MGQGWSSWKWEKRLLSECCNGHKLLIEVTPRWTVCKQCCIVIPVKTATTRQKKICTSKRAKYTDKYPQAQCLQAAGKSYGLFSKHWSNTLSFCIFLPHISFPISLPPGISSLSSSTSLCEEVWLLAVMPFSTWAGFGSVGWWKLHKNDSFPFLGSSNKITSHKFRMKTGRAWFPKWDGSWKYWRDGKD